MRKLMVGIALVLGFVAVDAGSQTAAGKSRRCIEPGGRILAVNPTAVVYRIDDGLVGCLRSSGKRVLMGGVGSAPGADTVEARRFQLAGRFVAFERVQTGERPSFLVEWVDLRSGRQRARETGPRNRFIEYGSGPLTDLVVNERGATAWIASDYEDPTTFQVRVPTAEATRQLDVGASIDPRSLVRKGARQVCWTVDATQRCEALSAP